MRLVIPLEQEMRNRKIVAVNVDRQPVMEFKDEPRGSSLVLELSWQISKGRHALELLLEGGVYKKFSFEI